MSSSSVRLRVGGALLALSLAGCGFQLSSQQPLSDRLRTIAIVTDDTRSELYLALERELASRGVDINPMSGHRIELASEETGQRVLSVSVRNIPREFEVYYTVAYRYVRDREVLIDRPALTSTRDYNWRETEVLGKLREEQRLRALIVDELVATILRQIASVS